MSPPIKEVDIVGFGDPAVGNDGQKKKKSGSGGGFQNMGLSFPVLKGILKRGYKVPTPIQRKTIPLVMEGRDVVAMARTGSGKTACFLIPMFEKLKNRAAAFGPKALILAPTRELALQTQRFVKEIGRFSDLKSAAILGGDSMETQFTMMHSRPDLIVATPGRFLHICVEMDLKLDNIEYVVFDEADRLFEMGFGDQLREIVYRLPDTRQTLLFSATLPKVLVEFARAGLTDPVLLRLDVESKLPDTLDLSFISCRSEEKSAVLLCLLKHVLKPTSQSVVFAATKHHIEYIHMLLSKTGITNTYIYSNLDQSARKINAAKFQNGRVQVLIVTDVAARGIDIPQLDNVINYNFPAKPKLFVHRVGRCARAGRYGHAYSLVAGDELCYLLDLHLFLGRGLSLAEPTAAGTGGTQLGKAPQHLLEEEFSEIINWHGLDSEFNEMRRVCSNAYKQYLRSRPGASTESVKRVKELNIASIGVHPVFAELQPAEADRDLLLAKMKQYRPLGTVFEIGHASTSNIYSVMKTKRAKHSSNISNFHRKEEERLNDRIALKESSKAGASAVLEESNADDITMTFSKVIGGSKRKASSWQAADSGKRPRQMVDKDNFIPYKPADQHTEQGLSVNNFQREASKAGLELLGDSDAALKAASRVHKVWDKRRKRMVGVQDKVKKIRSESGAMIPVTFKSGRYKSWVERTKADVVGMEGNSDEEEDTSKDVGGHPNTHWSRHNSKIQAREQQQTKRPDQILKARELMDKKRRRNARKPKKNRRKK